MSKKSIVMLVFACIFTTITAILLVLDSMTSISAYSIFFGPSDAENFGEALGEALGGIFLFLYTILIGIGIVISCIATLPFLIVLIKMNGMKKWYNIVLLSFTCLAFLAAIFYVAMLPTLSKIEEAAKASNSSSSNPSSAAMMLFL